MRNAILKNCLFPDGTKSDLFIKDGLISDKNEFLFEPECIEADGLYALPSLVDLHVHLRDPGFTHKETIATGIAAAKSGGIGTVVCMPNTNPPIDSPETVRYIIESAREQNSVRVLPCGCITKGQQSDALCDFSALKEAGVCALSDDGKPVKTAALMKDALISARKAGLVILSHCEELSLASGGVMNEGVISKKLGVKGIPNSAEDIGTVRDIILAGETGAHIHIAHVSTKSSVEIIRTAKKLGIPVTAESCPHYFTLTEEALLEHGTNAKMNPPLRTEEDKAAIIEALCDGTIDCISTDHAPHSETEKSQGLIKSPMGIVGLETSFALSYTNLIKKGYLTVEKLLNLMYYNPLKILGLPANGIKNGNSANILLVDLKHPYRIDKNTFQSMGRNTPFDQTLVYGKIIYNFI